ncbi:MULTISPECIES: group II intron maturase-specific domain-containing protein [Paraburkholderia]|uniref:group II intron maturase-specific domain-containing protein n=1 Tax=Paraburkholderia TaxID=1822464 RepID=UPI00165592F2|nr:group II intron maturase-specific domain-containing protein [Paraburkholderia podalyriae]
MSSIIDCYLSLVRYADDFLITGYSKELLEDEVKPLVEVFLQERGLTLSLEKTRITHISQGFDFLGQNIRKYPNGKLRIKPSKKNVQTFLMKVRAVINDNASAEQVNLIGLLNPIIDGWSNYHRYVVSKEVYSAVDTTIWQALWKWCCGRHPSKGARWIRARYFHREGTRH